MIVNKSRLDRGIRGAAAVAALIVAFAVGASTWPGIALLAIAVIMAGHCGGRVLPAVPCPRAAYEQDDCGYQSPAIWSCSPLVRHAGG